MDTVDGVDRSDWGRWMDFDALVLSVDPMWIGGRGL